MSTVIIWPALSRSSLRCKVHLLSVSPRPTHLDSIYCSAATKELLLRLERYPHRVNFELGILEARKQTYKHLQKLLKPIPLETPTRIELQPGKDIQVTLFDANHCTGAVMFCTYNVFVCF